jgi:UDP-N-acetylmuramate dehydrogenase
MPSFLPIAPYLAMKCGGLAARLEPLTSKEGVVKFVEISHRDDLPIYVIGDGTNTLFSDGEQNVAVGKMEIKGIERISEDNKEVILKVGAGENWDELVSYTVAQGWTGLEALSAIPGTVGAGPIQNIGAYGSEIKDTLEFVEVYDPRQKIFVELKNGECKFSYRESIFKRERKSNIIVGVTLKLKKKKPKIPHYPDVEKYFQERKIVEPTLKQIREVIMAIRARKLPDPKLIPNCGSFFKNPIISDKQALNLKTRYPSLASFKAESGTKLSAGWLIEARGFKGKDFGSVQVYPGNALVLTTKTGASTKELLNAAKIIISGVQERFGVTLEREPVLLPTH